MYYRTGVMNFELRDSGTGETTRFGFASYPFDDEHIIVYKNEQTKVVSVKPDPKPGYCYRILKTGIKCRNGLESFLEFIKRDLRDIEIGGELHCTFSDFVARKAFEMY